MITLVIRNGKSTRRVAFASGSVSVGRGESSDIQIDDRKCSRKHLIFSTLEGALIVRDAGSSNGSSVNGVKIKEVAPLHHGDRVKLGDTEIEIVAPELPPAPRLPPPAAPPLRSAADATVIGEDESNLVIARRAETSTLQERLPIGVVRLLEINHRLASAADIGELLVAIVESAMDLTGAERGFLLERDGDRLSFAVARDSSGNPVEAPSSQISRSVVTDALKRGEAVHTGNARGDRRFEEAVSVASLSLASVLCAPLLRDRRVQGVLYVDAQFENAFDESHRQLMGHLADLASIALEQAFLKAALQARSEELGRSKAEVERLCSELAEEVRVTTAELNTVRDELDMARARQDLRFEYAEIRCVSAAMREVLGVIDRVTDLDVPVCLEGESGTGKELVARALHMNSPRAHRPLMALNCAALSESLLESELFGVMRGAFTGADRDRKGLIELSAGGTLFLDEVGEMSLAMQAKLLRVLQEGEVRPVGGKDTRHVDFRLVTATNRKLKDLVAAGGFRADLFYRIRGVAIELPPLRARREDIPVLVQHFLERYCAEGQKPKTMTKGLVNLLTAYDWPGNVRQLEQEVRRLMALGDQVIDERHVSPEISAAGRAVPTGGTLGGNLHQQVDELERRAIGEALVRHDGNKSRVAEELGLSRPGLAKKMRRLGLEA